ncbi:anti-sigma factor [Nonomuraea zeae]|uniref:Regulator of SigK n=1 Tax=Nonomuraea zeae TaxID=1642303 RepID=A0A5S4GDM6_9ACTN|nr:anti-sigma factor [Nonomuraea zeae]TMR31105.1 hypothetical protein ETD85_26995 [Nonomuraea zeae]
MNDELHTLSGAYAVHALPYAEWVLFEEHLLACPGCWSEVRRLRETAARLAEAVAEPPPARLRKRLLDAAHRSRPPDEQRGPEQGPGQGHDDSPTIWRPPATRGPVPLPIEGLVEGPIEGPGEGLIEVPVDGPTLSLPPENGDEATLSVPPGDGHGPTLNLPPGDGHGPTLNLLPGDGWQEALRPVQAVPVPAAGLPAPVEGGGQVVPLRRGRSKALAGLAAVAAAAAVALGVVAFDARRDLGDATARNEGLIAVLAAPDAETMRQPITSGGTGTVVISRSAGRMLFASSGLRELPATQAYELWLMGPDGPRPAGMLAPAAGGLTEPMLLTTLGDDDHVALTVEPANGSDRPTTPPVMLAQLPTA